VLIGFPQRGNDVFLFREIGAAILTTATGLFMRQILLASDRAEEAQDRIFRTIAEEVRKDTLEFHDAQKLFVKLIKEFVQAREEMFSDEEKAFAEYLKALKDGAQRVGALPKRVETVMVALENTGSRVAEISSELESGLRTTAERYRHDIDGLTDCLMAGRKQLSNEIVNFAQGINEVAKRVGDFRDTMKNSVASTEQATKMFNDSVNGFSSRIHEAERGIGGLITELSRMTSDMQGIDQITDDLIRVLRDRLGMLSETFHRERSV